MGGAALLAKLFCSVAGKVRNGFVEVTELCDRLPAKKLWTTSSLNSVLYFLMKPLEVRPTSGGQFKPGAIHCTKAAKDILLEAFFTCKSTAHRAIACEMRQVPQGECGVKALGVIQNDSDGSLRR